MLQPQISRGVHSCQGWCLYLLYGKNDLCLDKRGKCQKELSNKKKQKNPIIMLRFKPRFKPFFYNTLKSLFHSAGKSP